MTKTSHRPSDLHLDHAQLSLSAAIVALARRNRHTVARSHAPHLALDDHLSLARREGPHFMAKLVPAVHHLPPGVSTTSLVTHLVPSGCPLASIARHSPYALRRYASAPTLDSTFSNFSTKLSRSTFISKTSGLLLTAPLAHSSTISRFVAVGIL